MRLGTSPLLSSPRGVEEAQMWVWSGVDPACAPEGSSEEAVSLRSVREAVFSSSPLSYPFLPGRPPEVFKQLVNE